GIDHPLDAFVDANGTALVHTSRPDLRPLGRDEIRRVLDVGLCLPCHRDLRDPVMRAWRPGRMPRPCRHAPAAARP
ncbi:cytochrome C, partial [Dissulfurirhabdus thermomarina]|nr:cytochrome C [Dissulfurirhabdus thermomarina]